MPMPATRFFATSLRASPAIIGRVMALVFAMASVTACGFEPLYAVDESGSKPGFQSITLAQMQADEAVAPVLQEAFERRMTSSDQAEYDLYIEADERAERLAVQIDSTVTRFNYRLLGSYILVNRVTGSRLRGRATAVASFNVVSSQYSTLFAERTAREKAARTLVDEIERDILLKLDERAGR